MRTNPIMSATVQALRGQYPGQIGRLVFSRQPGEIIVINNDITVTFVERRGEQVRLRVEAASYVIRRNELGRPSPTEVSPGGASFGFSRKLKNVRDIDKEGFWIGPYIYVEVYKKGTRVTFATTTFKNVSVNRGSVEAKLRALQAMPNEDS